jgi:hypothetical protein
MGKGRYLYDDLDAAVAQLTASSTRDGQVGLAVKNGTGAATATAGGAFTGATDLQYRVEIDSIAAGAEVGQATFKWRDGSVAGWNATGVATSASPITLNNGVTVTFASGTGADFAAGDRWDVICAAFYGLRQVLDRNRDTAWRSKVLASPEWIRRDLGSARQVTAVAIADHNISSGATIALAGNSADSWAAPAYSLALAWAADTIVAFLDQTYRYWRLEIDDPTNPDGYIEVGDWFLGSYFEPDSNYDRGWSQNRVATETIVRTDAGARTHLVQAVAEDFELRYRTMSPADRTGFRALEAAMHDVENLRGRPCWFVPDADAAEAHLVTLPDRLAIRSPFLQRYELSLTLTGVPRTVC